MQHNIYLPQTNDEWIVNARLTDIIDKALFFDGRIIKQAVIHVNKKLVSK
jgi:hypothetical protein